MEILLLQTLQLRNVFIFAYGGAAPLEEGEERYMYAFASLAKHDGAAILAQLGHPDYRALF